MKTFRALSLFQFAFALTAIAEPTEQLERFQTENGLTALVAGAWKGDDPIFREVFGESQTGVPATLDAKFRAGGVCLTALTAVLLQTVDKGLVELDDPIAPWLPDLPNADRVTLRMLANCTSGYGDYVANEDFVDAILENPFRTFTPGELIDYGLANGELYSPGEGWAYTHTTFVMLGIILEQIHGKSVPTLLEESIFQPLNLSDTVYTEGPSLTPPVLHSYTTEREVFEDSTFWNPSWTSYSGSVASTLDDVAKIFRAIGKGLIFSAESHAALTEPTTVGLGPNTKARFYGMGMGVVDGWLMQNPNMSGYQGIVAYDPENDITVVAFMTHGQASDPFVHYGMRIFPILQDLVRAKAL